jgi:hypothetical protein
MILPKIRDPRFITIRRGGTLTDENHYLLATWAAKCAEHVLPLFEGEIPNDKRPRKAIELAFAWANREITLNEAKKGAWESNNAARTTIRHAKYSAFSAGQAAVVGHVPAHELGAAAYAIRAVITLSESIIGINNAKQECEWQREQLPVEIRELVIDDEIKRNEICWNVFSFENTY